MRVHPLLLTLIFWIPSCLLLAGNPEVPGECFLVQSPLGRGGLVDLRDGRLMMVGAGLLLSYSEDGGCSWSASKPLVLEGQPIKSDRDPVCVLRLQSGALALVYGQKAQPVGSPPGHNLYLRKSKDEGQSWSREVQINVPGVTASPYHDTLIQLESGRLLLPVRWLIASRYPELEGAGAFGTFRGLPFQIEGHAHFPEMDTTFVYVSDDEGETWQASDEIVIWHKDGFGGIWPTDEPSAVQLKEGRVLMWMRTTLGRLYQSLSDDGGLTWHLPQPSDLASSYSPARLRRIPGSGDLLALWNQVSRDEIRRGYRRGRLSLAISSDEGRTWTNFKTLHVSKELEEIAELPPDAEEPAMVRALKKVGAIADSFSMAAYPNARFVGNRVYILYDYRGNLAVVDGKPQFATSERRVLVCPIDWLYSP